VLWIVLKSSYALGEARATENVAIDKCMVSGHDLGTLYDGTFKIAEPYGRTGWSPERSHCRRTRERAHWNSGRRWEERPP